MSIYLRDITKKYGDEVVFENVNLQLEPDEIIGLVGPNGAGKTTLMKIINENIVKFTGQITRERHKRMGCLIEEPKMYPNLIAKENLECFNKIFNLNEDITWLIEKLEMEEFGNKKAKNFSLGMKQKLAIAMSMIGSPDVILLDEPTNGLDPDATKVVLDFLKEIKTKKKACILISSHQLEIIEDVCDSIVFLKNGKMSEKIKVNAFKTVKKIYLKVSNESKDKLIKLLNNLNIKFLNENDYIMFETEDAQEIIKTINQNEIDLMDINIDNSNLRDYYFKL